MGFLDNVICPISDTKIDNTVSRLTVFQCAVLLALYLWTGIPYLVLLVALDYGIRTTGNGTYSPLRWVALRLASAANLPNKPTDQAPKIFASRVGFLFAATSALLFPFAATASTIVAGILLIFTILDSVFDFCVGCLTYSYVVLPFYKWRGIR